MKNRSILDSFDNALQGVIYTLKNERNFKIHFASTIFCLIFALLLRVDGIQFLILCSTITMVMVTELLNTAIENVVDLYCKEEKHELAKIAKDTAAGAVFLASLNALIVGYVIFFTKLIKLGIREKFIEIVKITPIYATLICVLLVLMLTIFIKTLTKSRSLVKGGMPSAHSAISFSLATCIVFLVDNTTVIAIGYFLAILVAQSRVEGMIHSLLQVVLGSLLGIFVTVLIFQVLVINIWV